MRSFFLTGVLGLLLFSPLTAQSRGTGSGSPGMGADVSGALSQMEGALAQPDNDISFQDSYFLGRAVAVNILSRYGPYTAKPALTHYLNQICAAITINSPTPEIYGGYHVSILDSPDLNAFATSGGHIFVCRGLLEAVSSEDALAAVLAHEIAHIQLKHSDEVIKNMRLTQALSDIAQRAGDIAAREAGLREREVLFSNYVREMVTTLIEKGYSRDKELEADSYALTLLALAGYSPASLVEVLTLLQKAGGVDGYNGTHPSPAQRINNVRTALPRYRVQDTQASRVSRFADSFK